MVGWLRGCNTRGSIGKSPPASLRGLVQLGWRPLPRLRSTRRANAGVGRPRRRVWIGEG